MLADWTTAVDLMRWLRACLAFVTFLLHCRPPLAQSDRPSPLHATDAARWRVGLPPFPALLLPQAPAAGPEKASTDAAAAAAAAALADKKAAKPAAKSEAEQSEAKSEAAQSEAKDVDAEEAKEKELASTNA